MRLYYLSVLKYSHEKERKMKHALVAFVILLGFSAMELQARTPYQEMADMGDTLKVQDGAKKLGTALHLLTLATVGHTADTKSMPDLMTIDQTIVLNISAERANGGEKAFNIRAIAIAAFLTRDNSAGFSAFFDKQKAREGIQSYEHDHIHMASIIFGAASNYFRMKSSKGKSTVDAFLETCDIHAFRTKDTITSHSDLIEFLNDFTEFPSISSHFGVIDSLAALFDIVAREHTLISAPRAASSNAAAISNAALRSSPASGSLLADHQPPSGSAVVNSAAERRRLMALSMEGADVAAATSADPEGTETLPPASSTTDVTVVVINPPHIPAARALHMNVASHVAAGAHSAASASVGIGHVASHSVGCGDCLCGICAAALHKCTIQ